VFIVLEMKQAQLELTVYLTGGSEASTVNKYPLTGPDISNPAIRRMSAKFSGVGENTKNLTADVSKFKGEC
jgi:hypothetical protein